MQRYIQSIDLRSHGTGGFERTKIGYDFGDLDVLEVCANLVLRCLEPKRSKT